MDNAQGKVAHVKDNLLGRIHESKYDLADHPCRVKVHERMHEERFSVQEKVIYLIAGGS